MIRNNTQTGDVKNMQRICKNCTREGKEFFTGILHFR